MAHDHNTTVVAPPTEGSRVNNSDRPQELQEIHLVVQDVNETTIEILLRGHVIVHSHSRRGPQSSGGGDGQASGGDRDTTTATTDVVDDVDARNLESIRGWLMAAATLFVGIAYQAATQPPAWMPSAKDAFDVLFAKDDEPSTSSVTKKLASRTLGYIVSSTVSFALSLTLVVLLPTMNDQKLAMPNVIFIVKSLALTIALTFGNAISDDGLVGAGVLVFIYLIYVYLPFMKFVLGFLETRLRSSWGRDLVRRMINCLNLQNDQLPAAATDHHSRLLADQQHVL